LAVSSAPSCGSDDGDDGSATAVRAARSEAAFWKGQFEALQEVRETEPERRMGELTSALGARSQQVNALVVALTARGPPLMKETAVTTKHAPAEAVAEVALSAPAVSTAQASSLKSLKAEPDASEAEADGAEEEDDDDEVATLLEAVEGLEAKLEEKRELLRAYMRLTGIALTLGGENDNGDDDDDDETTVVRCTAINHIHKRVAKFDLVLPTTTAPASSSQSGSQTTPKTDATFIPTANKQLLPGDMQKVFCFDSAQLPVLCQRMLKQLYASK